MQRMHEHPRSKRFANRRGLRLLLIFSVLFALWHISQHDVQSAANAEKGGHCSVCRLNHVPIAGGAVPVLFAAIFAHAAPRAAIDVPYLRSKPFLPRLSRGPPRF